MDLKDFLKKPEIKIHKLYGFTHTSMPGSKIPANSYYIPDDKIDEFHKIYYQYTFEKGEPAHITEAPDSKGISPFKIDIDLKYLREKLTRIYDENVITELVRYYYEGINEWVLRYKGYNSWVPGKKYM